MGQKRGTCKGKGDDSTEHFKTLNLLSQTPVCTGNQAPAPAGREWDLLYNSTAVPKPFTADSIFAEHAHSKEDFTKVHRNGRKCIRNMVKVPIICAGFWGSPPGSTGFAFKSPAVLLWMWSGSQRKGLCLPGKEILQGVFVYVYFCIMSSFSSCVKPFDIRALSTGTKGLMHVVFFLPEQSEGRMSAHRCMCTLAATSGELQLWETSALLPR